LSETSADSLMAHCYWNVNYNGSTPIAWLKILGPRDSEAMQAEKHP